MFPTDKSAIYLDETGAAIPRPELPDSATIDEFIAWMRAMHAYRDKITDIANRAFDEQFHRSLKENRRG